MPLARKAAGAVHAVQRAVESAPDRQRTRWRRWRIRAIAATEVLATRAGAAGSAASRALLLAPHRAEHVPEPPPLRAGELELDVVADLEAYTRLPRARVVELLQRRHESFRSEWQSFPSAVREDHWYYLASRTYLFANAVHLHSERSTLENVLTLVPVGSRVLDFGGGTGNLALSLAASGRRVTYLELSALQRDFVRFRTARHGLTSALEILDWWAAVPHAVYDVVVALDVLEHVPDLEETLENRLLPALRPGGMLVESSPFVRSLSNPMHREDGDVLDRVLERSGFLHAEAPAPLRAWRAPADGDAE